MNRRASASWHEPILPLMTPAELPAVDAYMEKRGTSGFALMERAGEAIGKAAYALVPDVRRVVVVAGSTNNGGDCMFAASVMRRAGFDVTLALFAEFEALKGDPARAVTEWIGPFVKASPTIFAGADLVVDGLYGGGHKHNVTGEAAAVVAAGNSCGSPVLAVDFPSGIAGESGAVLGTAVKADMTITFFCLKPGHLLLPGRAHCGKVVVDSIGIPSSVMDGLRPLTFRNHPTLWLPAISGQIAANTKVQVLKTRNLNIRAARRALADEVTLVIAADKSTDPAGPGELVSSLRERGSSSILVADDESFADYFPSVAASKVERARSTATASDMIVTILGADATVAAPDGRVAIAGNGGVGQATAADCDIVAEIIGAYVGHGKPSFEAAAAAAWALGEVGGSADLAGAMTNLLEMMISAPQPPPVSGP